MTENVTLGGKAKKKQNFQQKIEQWGELDLLSGPSNVFCITSSFFQVAFCCFPINFSRLFFQICHHAYHLDGVGQR